MERREFVTNSLVGLGLANVAVIAIVEKCRYKSDEEIRHTRITKLQKRAVNKDLPYVQGKGFVYDYNDIKISLARDYFYSNFNSMMVKKGDLIVRVSTTDGDISITKDRLYNLDHDLTKYAAKLVDESLSYIEMNKSWML